MIIASRHDTRNGVPHLRAKQTHYSDELKSKLQRVGSPARWLQGENTWDWPLTSAAVIALEVVAKQTGETIEWRDELREFAEQHIKQAEIEHQTRVAIERIIRDPKIPIEPYACIHHDPVTGEALSPTRYQGILYHWSQRVRGILMAWDPGTGKTRGATDASGGWYRNGLIPAMTPTFTNGRPGVEGGVLVVAPKTVLRTWQVELAKWQNASGLIISGQAERKTRLAGTPAHYHITNYESLKYVEHNHYAAMIVDEIHRCANHTNQTIHVMSIAQRARKVLGLSGTPMANNLESIFYPMLIVDGGRTLGSSKTAFLEKYFDETVGHGGYADHDPKEHALEQISAAMAESSHFINKEEVLPDLPKKTHTPIFLEMTPEQAKYYKELKKEALLYIQDATVTLEATQAKIMKLMQLSQGFVLTDDGTGRHFNDAKTEALMELLTDTLSQRKVIVWAYFQYEIKRIAEALREKGIKYVRVDGTITSQRERDNAVDRWNNDPEVRVYIRQLSMSEGVTLLAKECEVPCYDCIYMGLSYRYIDWKQSQDRIHRLGQKYPCSYTYLLTENGYDRKVYDSVLDKSNLATMLHSETKDYFLRFLTDAA